MSARLFRLAPRGLVLLLLALALGGAAVWLTAGWLDRAAQASAQQARAATRAQTVDLLVSLRDLQPGDVLTPEMIGRAPWPRAALLPQHLVAEEVGAEALAGGIVRTALAAGQPLTTGHIVRRGEQGVLAALIAPGHRAVTIAVSPAAGLAGLVGPGDRVDILLTAPMQGGQRILGLTVVENVRVLGVDQRLRGGSPPDDSGPPSTVTLEVTPEQAEALAVAQEMGHLSLSLRNIGAEPPARAGPARTWDSDVTRLGPAAASAMMAAAAALPPAMAMPPVAPAMPAPAASPATSAVAAGPASGTAVENGVQVVRGSSIRAAPAAAGGEGAEG